MMHRTPASTLDDEVRLLRVLQRTSAAIASKRDVRGVAQAVIDSVIDASGAESTALCLAADRERGEALRVAWEVPARAGDPRGAPLPVAIDRAGVLVSDDLLVDPRRTALVGDIEPGARSYLVAPIVVRDDVVGGIVLGHRAPGAFTECTARLVAGIAAQTATAIHNARIHDQLLRISEERARLLTLERAARAHHERNAAETGAMLARLLHDLRAPLNAIVGWSEVLLARDAGCGCGQRHGLEVIARNACVQAELLAQLAAHGASSHKPALADAVAPVVTLPRHGSLDISLAGTRVLVIDDDQDARTLVKTILNDARADAVTAASAEEGLVLLRQLRPDVIVSDVAMSVRDGYQFMRLVRTMSPSDGGRTPALAFTASGQAGDRVRALLAGYQEHIVKPVQAGQLVAAVQRLAALAP